MKMENIQDYINSGILELYVLGMTTEEETIEIAGLAAKHLEISQEIEAITTALEFTAEKFAPEISPAVKEMIRATIDYTERLKNGEAISHPPLLSKTSTIADFSPWISREDMQVPDDFEALYAKIIASNPQATTIIVWLRYGAPIEVHRQEYEHFLIVEGTCTITIGEEAHSLVAGDYLSIPLHIGHSVAVTSSMPCKIILQRVAA
jgi:mannose-6-phosphate isomerase-like protein (cupin superfamily)